MTVRSACILSFAGPLLLGCSVGAGELSPSALAVNQCEDDTSCYAGYCDSNKTCRGLNGELTSLLLAVTPGPTPGIANVTYYQHYPDDIERVDPDGGVLDIKLSPAINVTKGTVHIDTAKDCIPSFRISPDEVLSASPAGLIPPDITFTPSERVPGIPNETYRADRLQPFVFQANLAPAQYDFYIRPAYPASANPATPEAKLCEVPPRLVLNQSIASELNINLAPASELEVTIEWPLPPGVASELATAEQMLGGWTVDVLEPVSGRLLSTRITLRDPLAKGSAFWTYDATLSYSPVYEPVKGVLQPKGVGSELVRLSPPSGVTAPLILAEAGGAQLFDSPAAIKLAPRMPEPVEVEFQTSVAGVPQPVPAGVVFTAKELDNVDGISTAFSRTVPVDDKGIAATTLLPGRYRVVASPKGGCTAEHCLATTVTEWIVPASPLRQAGKTIEFNPAPRLEGGASVANGGPAVGASVRAIASSSILAADVLNSGDGQTEVLPRASSGLVGSEGEFSFEADAGIFDFRVEPDPTTGFGWLVKPRVVFPVTDDTLSALSVPLPVVYQGTVTLDDPVTPSSIPGALIRAYVYVDADGTFSSKPVEGGVAVQVAETRADEAGNYTLLIPRVLGSER